MTANTSAFQQLKVFLKDMFQFEEHDLDFGIYRITRLKRQFIQAFIDGQDENSLQRIVSDALSGVQNSQGDSAKHWLEAFASTLGKKGEAKWKSLSSEPTNLEAKKGFEELFVFAEDDNEREQAEAHLKTFTESKQLNNDQLEAKVYNHLLNFFELYYQNGDFGYNTRAATAFKVAYEADYDGSDTLFHWKHKDSYYIKSGNGFHSVRCQIKDEWLEFRLSAGGDDNSETSERNNNKDTSSKHYRLVNIQPVKEKDAAGKEKQIWQVTFSLSDLSTPKVDIYTKLWSEVFGQDELTAYLYKKPGKNEEEPGKPIFNDLSDDYDKADGGQVKGIGQLRIKFEKYVDELAKRTEFSDLGKNTEARKAVLEQDDVVKALWQIDLNLNKFYVGNDADYFIHKNLQGFLTGEKDRFIKQVIFSDLESLLHAGEDNVTVLIARAFNQVADKLISFLSAIEEFQKALFEVKKKVVDTHYLISVGKIPEHFYERVYANQAQLHEWNEVFKVELASKEELEKHPSLVVDTVLYSETDPQFQDDLLSDPAFDNLDEQTDGLLINSENWQALNLLQEKFREQIKCIYIDPPYNTGGDGFLYKDSFRHSSWASMIHDRLNLAHPLLSKKGVLFASIDDKERTQLEQQLKDVFGGSNRVEELIWAQNSTKNQSPTYSTNHEYVEVFAKDLEIVKADPAIFREPKPGYSEVMELVSELNVDYPAITIIESSLSKLYADHKYQLKAELEEQGIPFDKNIDPWKGIYNYKYAEYRTPDGEYVDESCAKSSNAEIWIWQEGDASMPSGKQAASTKDPGDLNYRFYESIHPITRKPVKAPKRGWGFPKNTDPTNPHRPSLSHFDAQKRIHWGESETKVPRIKKFIHELDTNVGRSVITDYTNGETQLTRVLGQINSFPNPKPTTLIERFINQSTRNGDWVMDFFSGSGTTGHSVLSSELKRRFLLVEMGDYFVDILKPRIKRLMFSSHWRDGEPELGHNTNRLVKIHSLEQYEDTLDNLQPIWDGTRLPKQISVRYLFRPEQNNLYSTIDLSRPFEQKMRIGKDREEKSIDLMETWCYLQGYWVKSRRIFRKGALDGLGRDYLAVETTHGTLVLFRDIDVAEDDTDDIQRILAEYQDDEGMTRIERLELNMEADRRRLNIDVQLIKADDFMRGAQWS